jgi:hypothetical protein
MLKINVNTKNIYLRFCGLLLPNFDPKVINMIKDTEK